jgi:adenylyltransferase/sulfurtransferase
MADLDEFKDRIIALEAELEALRIDLAEAEANLERQEESNSAELAAAPSPWPLRPEEYERYGRQLIIPALGIKGQLRLRASKVLIVGAGGLGCPAAAYVAGAGVGTLGLVDGDAVEVSNLHRQIAHATSRVGMPKVESAIAYLKDLNPEVEYQPHQTHLTPENAEDIVSKYDIVLDCTDHPTSRYLISDICVLLRKPLVSASAFRTDGQLIVLNSPASPQGDPEGGPCYRCVFPKPPPPESVISCGEGGILGPVVGVMGVLQALEAIKLIASGALEENAMAKEEVPPPTLLIFSGMSATPFRSVRMRGRRKDCAACGLASELRLEKLRSGDVDYVRFCGVIPPVSVLDPEERVSVADYRRAMEEDDRNHLLLDVREPEHFDIGSISGAVNIPIGTIMSGHPVTESGEARRPEWIPPDLPHHAPIYVVCRVGNDSQLVARRLKELGLDEGGARFVGDIRGGMRAWKDEVDPTMPFL